MYLLPTHALRATPQNDLLFLIGIRQVFPMCTDCFNNTRRVSLTKVICSIPKARCQELIVNAIPYCLMLYFLECKRFGIVILVLVFFVSVFLVSVFLVIVFLVLVFLVLVFLVLVFLVLVFLVLVFLVLVFLVLVLLVLV